MSRHNVTALEIELVAERVGKEKLTSFRRFLDQTGEFEVCPYFDEELWGCGIYQTRPYSCRVFGHHRRETTRLPELCVFSGQESVFAVGEYLAKVPLSQELKELARSFWPYQSEYPERTAITGHTAPTAVNFPLEGDVLDRALGLMNEGQLQAALAEFERSDLPSTPYVLYCLSLVFEGMAHHDQACTALQVALEQAPDCAPLWFRLGCNLHSLGKTERGVEAFERVVTLDESHALAHAFLGSLHLQSGRLKEARSHLSLSLELRHDPTVERWLQAAG